MLGNNAVIQDISPVNSVSARRGRPPVPGGIALCPVSAVKMSDEDETAQRARRGFEELCRALNMDEEASGEAWRSYENISRNFTLEVARSPGQVAL